MIPRFHDGCDEVLTKRFGLFVHWGLYAVPAWHEQIQWRRGIPRAKYVKLLDAFNPRHFDPDAWLDLAEEAGMEYVVITTKHHDGFCLWDTQQTDFNAMRSPYGRDIIGLLARACRRRRFPLGLYYSVVDWHHPNYPNRNRSHELAGPEPGDHQDFRKYMAFLRAQVRELCTRYGEIHEFWWDMNVTGHRTPSINAMIRELQPNIAINNRGFDKGDFSTPERHWGDVDSMLAFEKPTEACNSVGGQSWGYKTDEDYYTDRHLMQQMANALAKGGNFLLNVGPRSDGTIALEQVRILKRIGRWYGKVRAALHDAEPASALTDNRHVLLTRRGGAVYAILHRPPESSAVLLKPLAVKPRRAVLLNTGAPVTTGVDLVPYECPRGKPYLRLRNLPVNAMANEVMVVRLDFDKIR